MSAAEALLRRLLADLPERPLPRPPTARDGSATGRPEGARAPLAVWHPHHVPPPSPFPPPSLFPFPPEPSGGPMPHLADPNPATTPAGPVLAVLTGRTGTGQTVTEVLSGGTTVSTTTYPDGAWVAVHSLGHPGPRTLAARTLPRGLRLTSFVYVDGEPVPSEDRVDFSWAVRSCTAGDWAIVTRLPSDEIRLPRVHLTVPTGGAAGREDS
ncbi:hypothetical protein [Kitasatospora camelliae]|uniref:Uncharacterized protein n=1 Tax=Kitasatospora camelliae TaxID=3156397 RepID=A0AAU8JPI2_9ACTN